MSNFDRIAPFYDSLSRLVFGKAMHRAQTKFLKEIDPYASVLVLGGGTGWLLAELLLLKPRCTVVYIEASQKMIEMSRKKLGRSSENVLFIHGTEDNIPGGTKFGAIITNFYLDLFEEQACQEVCRIIRGYCSPECLWIACDFVNVAWWHNFSLRAMYLFFGWVSNLRTKRLPDWRKCIQNVGFAQIGNEYEFNGLICSALYRLSRR
jgi:tRNA (cmo5U34)-methyltransferase